MSTIRNPVGPEPASVYWRRRIVALLLLLAVVVIIVLIVVRPGAGDGQTQTPTPDPTGTATPTPSQTFAAGEEPECDPAVVKLTPVTDSNSYAAGQMPMISMTIENVGAVPCTFDVGTSAQEYLIMSGSDRIWSSRDCQTGATSNVIVLEPGEPLSTTPFPWDRTRSSTSTCDQQRPQVIAGGATYRLSVSLGDATSDGDVPFLLH